MAWVEEAVLAQVQTGTEAAAAGAWAEAWAEVALVALAVASGPAEAVAEEALDLASFAEASTEEEVPDRAGVSN